MKFFNLYMTTDSALIRFRELSKKLHPDNGGDDKIFADMKIEYEEYKAIKKHWIEIHQFILMTMRKPKPEIIYIDREPELEKSLNQVENIFNVGNSIVNSLSRMFGSMQTAEIPDE